MPRWTPQSRAKQRAIIQQHRPWEKSTGPKSAAGKLQSARNSPNHAPRAPGTHPRELRRSRRRLWKLWKLQLSLTRLGIFDADWAMALADQIVAVESGLGIDPIETQHRLTGSLSRLAKRRVSAAAKSEHSEHSERVPDSVA